MRQINMDRRHRIFSLAKSLEEIANARHSLLLQLEDLATREKVVQAEHNILHNLEATTSNVADEIMAMIFGMGMTISHEENPLSPWPFGEVVSLVSHRWRSIALDTPSLWTFIKYTLRPLRGCAAYLSRSRLAPVDIYIAHREVNYSLLQSINEHFGRCRSFCVFTSTKEDVQRILECVSCHTVPLLRKLSMGSYHPNLKFPAQLFPLGAPNLKIVQLMGLNFETIPQAFCLPAFEAVTHLRLSHVNINNVESYISFRVVLEALQHLSHLELHLQTIPELPPQLPIVLPALKFLRVDFTCRMNLNYINKYIHSSSLISLSLSGWIKGENALDESNLVKSHFPSLRHLFLTGRVSAALPQFDSLAKTYQGIERMTCRAHFDRIGDDIEDILAAILGNPAGEDEEDASRLPWPKMHAIAVEDMRKPVDASALRSIILKLRGTGSSIHTLLLPQVCVADGDVEALRDIIKIEYCGNEWPKPFSFFF
ncbi:hypothetical protein FIBSPDRAFT_150108 [Athelia psychrophila]|uniref:Uncharacterized protein n=1 Tax=Athelia psychrophila TaxID=1759441 RepID=A0A166BM49_9AGAM|nr:hypothetical protein FIBSPDRAFT_150108 [Fibularhizoctonia sp. CBS 109695]